MIIRAILALAAAAALAGCQPAVPDSGRGVGFGDDFTAQQRARDAALTGAALPAPAGVSSQPLGAAPVDGSAEATAAETARILNATRAGGAPGGVGNDAASNSGVEPLAASPSNPPPPVLNSAGISNENNFDAVSGQRSIDADAARLAANRQQYQVIQPEALPDRVESGPNVVAFALQTNHPKGTKVYRRGFTRQAKTDRACAAFSTADQAQIDFLARGGPQRDRAGMDPDGDGYACNWDPAPFRRAAAAQDS